MNLLTQKVLVLNRLWQAIDETDVQTAICDIVRGVATGIDMGSEPHMAVPWEVWATLPIREGDRFLRTIHGAIRVPTVICKTAYAKMPKRMPKLDGRGVAERDGYTCQYTGEYAPDGNLDHVIPRDQNGPSTWENLVWSKRTINQKKGNKTPVQAGLSLRRKPFKPKPIPACARIHARHPDWKPFLIGR